MQNRIHQDPVQSPTSARLEQYVSTSGSDSSPTRLPFSQNRLQRVLLAQTSSRSQLDDDDDVLATSSVVTGSGDPRSEVDDDSEDEAKSLTRYDTVSGLPSTLLYKDPGHVWFKTALTVVCANLPLMAEPYDEKLLKSTRGPQVADLTLDDAKHLTNIVFVPDLVTQLVQHVKPHLRRIRINDPRVDGDFIHSVLPWYTSKSNPSLCYSEGDVQRSFFNTLAQPAQRVVQAILEYPSRKHGSPIDIFGPEVEYPEFTSSEKGNVVADAVLRYSGKRKLVIELKTPGVLPPHIDLFAPILQATQQNLSPTGGDAVGFIWPTDSSYNKDFPTAHNTLCKVIVQVSIMRPSLSHLV